MRRSGQPLFLPSLILTGPNVLLAAPKFLVDRVVPVVLVHRPAHVLVGGLVATTATLLRPPAPREILIARVYSLGMTMLILVGDG